MEWQPMKTAPRQGQVVWAHLYQTGIRAVRYMSAEEMAELEGGDPSEYDPAWVEAANDRIEWAPHWWLPYDAIPEPPECPPE